MGKTIFEEFIRGYADQVMAGRQGDDTPGYNMPDGFQGRKARSLGQAFGPGVGAGPPHAERLGDALRRLSRGAVRQYPGMPRLEPRFEPMQGMAPMGQGDSSNALRYLARGAGGPPSLKRAPLPTLGGVWDRFKRSDAKSVFTEGWLTVAKPLSSLLLGKDTEPQKIYLDWERGTGASERTFEEYSDFSKEFANSSWT